MATTLRPARAPAWAGTSTGAGAGEFDVPYDVATDSSGNVYVADTGNERVDEFSGSVAVSTLTQGPPTSATVTDGAGYSGHLAVTNAAGAVSYAETASPDSSDVVVDSSGAITAAAPLASRAYTVSGSDSDTAGDSGTWTFTLTVNGANLPATTTTSSSAPPRTTTTITTTTTTATAPVPLPPPVEYRSENVALVSGKVYIAVPAGSSTSRAAAASLGASEALSKGLHYVPLTSARQIPVGSYLNTTGGTVAITAAGATTGTSYTADVTAGVSCSCCRTATRKGVTDFTLMDTLKRRKACATVGKNASIAKAKPVSSKVLGLLKSTDHGKFSTRGDYSAATARGTQYSVQDECAGTLTTVTRGSVVVDYFRRHKSIVVKSGQAFLAKASGGPSVVVSIGKHPAKHKGAKASVTDGRLPDALVELAAAL